MTLKLPEHIETYTRQRADILNMLDNMREFVESTPRAEIDATQIPNVDHAYVGNVARIHQHMLSACFITHAMSK